MMAQYLSALLYPVLAKLQAAEQQLTTRDISEISNGRRPPRRSTWSSGAGQTVPIVLCPTMAPC
jgi:hypothetical protein